MIRIGGLPQAEGRFESARGTRMVEECLAGLQARRCPKPGEKQKSFVSSFEKFQVPIIGYLEFFKAPLRFRSRTRSFRQAGAYVRHYAVMVPYLRG